MKFTTKELLEKRILELQAQISNLEFSEYSILERGRLRARLCNEYIELQQKLADLSAPIAPAVPVVRKRQFRNEDVLVMGTRHLKLLDAIERALNEAVGPLNADDIAYIILNNSWLRRLRQNSRAAVQDAIARSIDRGNKLGICVIGEGKKRRYWLKRKVVPASQSEWRRE